MHQAMSELGWKEANVYFVNDDDKAAVKRVLTDNRTGEKIEIALCEVVIKVIFDMANFLLLSTKDDDIMLLNKEARTILARRILRGPY